MLNTNWKRCTITGLAAMCVPLAAIVVTSPAYAAGDPASIAASSGEHRNPNPGIVPNRNRSLRQVAFLPDRQLDQRLPLPAGIRLRARSG